MAQDKTGDHLAQQYGGNSQTGWVSHLPRAWLPYIQLARLSPPAGIALIYFPHLFGILHAAVAQRAPPPDVVRASLLMLGGTVFFSNAAHVWNDFIDAPLDAKVERTRKRPIPRGAVSPTAALIFTITQAMAAAAFLPLVGSEFVQSAVYALPSIVGSMYYPWAKRHTNAPQLVLGLCLAWGIPMGSLALAKECLGFDTKSCRFSVDPAATCLFLASVLWTMIYDTIYAHQDLKDDVQAGIKSLAVLYRGRTKTLLWRLLVLMAVLQMAAGWLSGTSLLFYVIAVGGSTISLGLMIRRVDLQRTESCWWWFGTGFWYAGGSIAAGLFAEYLHALMSP